MIPLIYVLTVSLMMFTVGLYGILTVKGGIRLLISIEILVNSANLNIVAWAVNIADSSGIMFVLLSIAIAAAEAAIGFAIFVALYRQTKGIGLKSLMDLRW
ncbi:MAG: NADH-quinone oxidoreductase subunit NuoK [Thermoplasmata archaeon]|nr:NADH-quinone oxidoreductase subunit NuoK [Thermoplasmata archaeon]MVT13332.1 NADH-quinone oxidoreductase subunit NuoK [Euryarchaeota archaeon]MVT14384.1 NADH-quinone oxidoreductase subunit NuoK [Euryarchaeota archaeon]MVT35326.1 NADH-quinone oxidoreductase subunit NuoK [Euryarchaeota archaeon]